MASSININLSAKIELNFSVSILFPSGQVVDVASGSNFVPIPIGCNESLALTETSEATENLETDLASINSEPVQCSSLSILESVANKNVDDFASSFDRPNSSSSALPCLSPSRRSSPSSPSFSEINLDDLIWIPLPEIELDSSFIDCVIADDGDMVVEIIPCELFGEDDDVIFLKEVNRSGAKKE